MAKEEFKLVNMNDPNEQFELESTNGKDAALEALDMLGYGICSEGLKVKLWVKLIKKYPFRNFIRDRKKAGEKK